MLKIFDFIKLGVICTLFYKMEKSDYQLLQELFIFDRKITEISQSSVEFCKIYKAFYLCS